MKDQAAEKKADALKGAEAASAIRGLATAAKKKLSTLAREYYEKEVYLLLLRTGRQRPAKLTIVAACRRTR